jgi:hypothetical protein
MAEKPDPRIAQDEYIYEALDAGLLLAEEDGARGDFYREAIFRAVLVALDGPAHRSDRDRLRALFERAVAAT